MAMNGGSGGSTVVGVGGGAAVAATAAGRGGRGGAMGMGTATMGAKVPPPTISQSVSSAEQLHQQQQQQQHYRSLQRDAPNAAPAPTTGASAANPGAWQDGAGAVAGHYPQYGGVPAYGMHHHHMHQQQGMHPFRSLQRGTTAQMQQAGGNMMGGVHTSHSHSGHFRPSATKAAIAAAQLQQAPDVSATGAGDGTYANNDSERQLYAVTEL